MPLRRRLVFPAPFRKWGNSCRELLPGADVHCPPVLRRQPNPGVLPLASCRRLQNSAIPQSDVTENHALPESDVTENHAIPESVLVLAAVVPKRPERLCCPRCYSAERPLPF